MNAMPKEISDDCWGVSGRNNERTQSRNEAHLNFIFHNLEGVQNTSFLYQYCGHQNNNKSVTCSLDPDKKTAADKRESCRVITAIINPTPSGTRDIGREKRLGNIADVLGVPLISLYYAAYDTNYRRTVDFAITRNGKTEYKAGQKWRAGFLDELLTTQIEHENSDHRCRPELPNGDWLDGKGDAKIDHEYELKKRAGDDLTVSRILRQIAGVRHLDMDGCVTCKKCSAPIALIEASSDGYSRGNRAHIPKYTYMSRGIGQKLGIPTYLIQHDVSKTADCDSGCDITVWQPGERGNGTSISYYDSEPNLDDAIWHFEELIKKHSCG